MFFMFNSFRVGRFGENNHHAPPHLHPNESRTSYGAIQVQPLRGYKTTDKLSDYKSDYTRQY